VAILKKRYEEYNLIVAHLGGGITIGAHLKGQVAKDIGAMATVLKGFCDGVILTGALTRSERLLDILQSRISFIGRVFVFPEDIEMYALLESGREIITDRWSIIRYQ